MEPLHISSQESLRLSSAANRSITALGTYWRWMLATTDGKDLPNFTDFDIGMSFMFELITHPDIGSKLQGLLRSIADNALYYVTTDEDEQAEYRSNIGRHSLEIWSREDNAQ